jgi:beta-phosphoglucomutase-like phosphatase (HAD superfamily)
VGITALIFDFDGLMMDTESTALASWQYEWRQHGLELDAARFFVNHGGDVSADRYAELAGAKDRSPASILDDRGHRA